MTVGSYGMKVWNNMF